MRGSRGEPVAGAERDVWPSDTHGKYDVQHRGLDHAQARGTLKADARGPSHFRANLAVPVSTPDDGPVGDRLEASGRHPWRPAHLHFMIKAPGYETLITPALRRDGPYLDRDAVSGVRRSLIADG